MSSIDTVKWETIKTDLGKWLNKGFVVFHRGTLIVKHKTKEMSEEEKRQYQLIELKAKVHNRISDLGARVYALMSAKEKKNPAFDSKIKDITAHIKWYEAVITLLEKNPRKAVKRSIKKAA